MGQSFSVNFFESLHKEEWREVRLGEICLKVDYGYTASAIAQNTGTKFLRITDIVPSQIDWNAVPYCNIDSKNLEKYLLKVGDIVIARTGATAGYNKYIKTKTQCIFASYLIRFRANPNIANPHFISYCLQDRGWIEFVNGALGGSAQPNINAKQMSDFTFKLPPLPIQNQIAEILSSFDDKIDLLHRQNQTLESLALTLFRHHFIENPNRNEWKIGKLGEEFDFIMGVSPEGSSYNENQRGIPMFQGNADFGFRFPSNRIYTTKPKRLAQAFDVLISVRAPVGDVNMARESCCIGRGLAAFKHKLDRNLYSYTFYKVKSSSQEIQQFNDKGTIFGSISKGDFENIDVSIPPLEIAKELNQQLKVFDDKIYNNSKQIQSLEQMRDLVLRKIFSGDR